MLFTSTDGATAEVCRLFRFYRTLAHFETIHSLVHLHLLAGRVPHGRLAGAACLSKSFWILFLLADVRDSGVEVLPERFDTCLILALAEFFVSETDLVLLVIQVSCELLFVKVID